MDLIDYTDIRYLWELLDKKLILPFVFGITYGGLIGVGIALKKWWIPAILVLLPVVLAVASLLLPSVQNVTFRFFFLGVSALAVIGFAYWLSR